MRTLISYFVPLIFINNGSDLNVRERYARLDTTYKVTYETMAIKQHPQDTASWGTV